MRGVSVPGIYVNMADLISKSSTQVHKERTFAEEEALRQVIEMLFFAYRDFTSGPDEILREFGFGRAHHRAIYFIGRYPNQTVSNLLGILRITKQSLSRVLGQLVREGFVSQSAGKQDRRQRLLQLTEKGRMLEERLTANQRKRIAAAFEAIDREAVDGFQNILLGIMSSNEDRNRFK